MENKLLCPKCQVEISLADVNVATDIALCRHCGRTWSFADLTEEQSASAVDLARPPKGAWFSRRGRRVEVGISTRSPAAFFLVPFMCVWSGFSLGGIYGTQIYKGKFNLFESLFGIPFIIGTVIFGSIAVMAVCGKVVVRAEGDAGEVFTGVGPVGWRRRFKWSGVTAIRRTEVQDRRQTAEQITLEGERRLQFGVGVNTQRLDFMLAALRQMRRELGR